MTDPAPVIEVSINTAEQSALRSITDIEKIQEEIKNLKEMQTNILDNDQEYSVVKSDRDEKTRQLKAVRARVMNTPEAVARAAQIGELNSELKEAKNGLGQQLGLFYQQTGQSYVETPEGSRYWLKMGYKKGKNQ